ncbi:alpha/beta hydrolase [Hoeflea prorocentri]|uniref:Alpha/beta hydrolase n=1 Tax=Hoeflea prorocentri TaxID=1922333 RepID=A0A9X3ZJ91_9HYPH|nr:alpha/beta hydrolase [Hoeflea prorocentri]MCY6383204.1 alpha/beta hydrolase [Hoeflea prorocentri]MDA5401004.1 alpha/beta hydrolase [Hoeflea prorocentri]
MAILRFARRMAGPVLTVLVAYGAIAALMYLYQRQLVFQPFGDLTAPVENGLSDVAFDHAEMADGTRIAVWRKAPATPDLPTVLYFHGNGGNLTLRAGRYRQIVDSGLGLYAPTYRGYAGADGSPSETALISDALEHFDRLRAGTPDIILHGESLGTGVAVAVAQQRDAKALILEAPYTAAVDVAAATYPWLPARTLMRDPFPSRERIGEVDAPLLIVHGKADGVIPFEHGEALFAMANDPKELIVFDKGGHSNLWTMGLWPSAIDFLNRNGILPPAPPDPAGK